MTTRNCIAAMRCASGCSFTLPRKLASNGREAMSLLTKMSLLPKEGGGAPNGAPTSCRAAMRGRSRGPINKRDRSPFGAPPRSCAGNPTRPGPRFLESPDANGRTLSGTSAASTSQSGTRRTGRCPSRLKANSDELRPQEPHPLRQSASPVDVPYDERDGRRYSNPRPRCQRLFDLCRQIAGLRGAIAAARKPGRVSLRAKDLQKRSCACQSRVSVLLRIFAGLLGGVRIAQR